MIKNKNITFEKCLKKLRKEGGVIVLDFPINCCTHYNGTSQYYIAKHPVFWWIKFAICQDCNTAVCLSGTLGRWLVRLFGSFTMEVAGDEEQVTFLYVIKTDVEDNYKFKHLMIRKDIVNKLKLKFN